MENTIYHGSYDATGEKEAFHDIVKSLIVGFLTVIALSTYAYTRI